MTAAISPASSRSDRTRTVSLPTVWILPSAAPVPASASRVSPTEASGATTSQLVPPSNSMPRLSPRTASEPMLTATSTSDTTTALRHAEGKSICCSPR